MKTIQNIALEHINALRKREFVTSLEDVKQFGIEAAKKLQTRMTNDPAIIDVAEFYTRAMNASMVLPAGFREQAIRNVIMNAIMLWEDINREYDEQLKSHG